MKLGNKTFSLFIPESEIQKRVQELALEISEAYKDKDPLFVVILNGAFLFAADLIKEITVPCQVSFIKAASYSGTESRGIVDLLIGLTEEVSNRNIIIIDDIVDTGLTMERVLKEISKTAPASVAVASLLLKPETFQKQFQTNYVGFTIPSYFVVGYGLDYDGYGRNLKDIYRLQG